MRKNIRIKNNNEITIIYRPNNYVYLSDYFSFFRDLCRTLQMVN